MRTDSDKPSISKKEFMNLQATQAVINYWTQNNDGHFDLELYEKILREKEARKQLNLTK